MAKKTKKYDKYVIPCIDKAYKMTGFARHIMLNPKDYAEIGMDMWIDSYICYKAGDGWFRGRQREDGSIGTHTHIHTIDEAFIYLGTDPEDPEDLGGEYEFWLGEGDDAEQYVFDKSTIFYVPRFLAHNPQCCRECHRPFIVQMIKWGQAGALADLGSSIPNPKGWVEPEGYVPPTFPSRPPE